MAGRLQGKVAIVTGAGTAGQAIGNGKACAVLFAREGAKVLAVDLDMGRAQATAQAIQAEGGHCIACQADVSRAQECAEMVAQCLMHFGRIDVLQNNVGITQSAGPVELPEQEWDRVMNVNARSMFLTVKHVLPHMQRQGSGSIVNIGSINSERAIPFPKFAYAASKAAMIAMSREIAITYAAQGIRSNVVLVGLIRSPIVEQQNLALYGGDLERMWRTRDAMSPTGRQGEVWDVAQASLFLASDESRYVNAVVLPVDGGLVQQVKF